MDNLIEKIDLVLTRIIELDEELDNDSTDDYKELYFQYTFELTRLMKELKMKNLPLWIELNSFDLFKVMKQWLDAYRKGE